MPDLIQVYSFVMENLENVSLSRGGSHFNAKCPFCGDSKKSSKKKRFHIQFDSEDSIYFNCFNCYEKGNFYELYGFIKGITSKEAYKELNKFSEKLILNKLSKKSYSQSYSQSIPKLSQFDKFLNEECLSETSIPDGIIQKNYITKLKEFKINRNIDTKLFVCYTGKYKNRIIIPIFNDDFCVYFQGRSLSNKQYPKYLNPIAEKESVILNKNNFDRNKSIIITEGILDALSIGNQGTTCLGAFIKDEFIASLKKYTNKDIIIALDNDQTGREQTLKILQNSKYKKQIKYFFLEQYKDLNELLISSNINNLYKYVIDRQKSYLDAYSYIQLEGV